MENARFYVYLHKKPDGAVFYVGKGSGRRAFDMAPSRRTKHHANIIRKYGRDNIAIQLIPCMHETEAFQLERALIKLHSATAINLTDGGEGAVGRIPTKAQLEGLAKGRCVDKKHSEASLAALAKSRDLVKSWQQTEIGKTHLRELSKLGATVLHAEHKIICIQCGNQHVTRSAKAKCCSRLCEQRYRRARDNS